MSAGSDAGAIPWLIASLERRLARSGARFPRELLRLIVDYAELEEQFAMIRWSFVCLGTLGMSPRLIGSCSQTDESPILRAAFKQLQHLLSEPNLPLSDPAFDLLRTTDALDLLVARYDRRLHDPPSPIPLPTTNTQSTRPTQKRKRASWPHCAETDAEADLRAQPDASTDTEAHVRTQRPASRSDLASRLPLCGDCELCAHDRTTAPCAGCSIACEAKTETNTCDIDSRNTGFEKGVGRRRRARTFGPNSGDEDLRTEARANEGSARASRGLRCGAEMSEEDAVRRLDGRAEALREVGCEASDVLVDRTTALVPVSNAILLTRWGARLWYCWVEAFSRDTISRAPPWTVTGAALVPGTTTFGFSECDELAPPRRHSSDAVSVGVCRMPLSWVPARFSPFVFFSEHSDPGADPEAGKDGVIEFRVFVWARRRDRRLTRAGSLTSPPHRTRPNDCLRWLGPSMERADAVVLVWTPDLVEESDCWGWRTSRVVEEMIRPCDADVPRVVHECKLRRLVPSHGRDHGRVLMRSRIVPLSGCGKQKEPESMTSVVAAPSEGEEKHACGRRLRAMLVHDGECGCANCSPFGVFSILFDASRIHEPALSRVPSAPWSRLTILNVPSGVLPDRPLRWRIDASMQQVSIQYPSEQTSRAVGMELHPALCGWQCSVFALANAGSDALAVLRYDVFLNTYPTDGVCRCSSAACRVGFCDSELVRVEISSSSVSAVVPSGLTTVVPWSAALTCELSKLLDVVGAADRVGRWWHRGPPCTCKFGLPTGASSRGLPPALPQANASPLRASVGRISSPPRSSDRMGDRARADSPMANDSSDVPPKDVGRVGFVVRMRVLGGWWSPPANIELKTVVIPTVSAALHDASRDWSPAANIELKTVVVPTVSAAVHDAFRDPRSPFVDDAAALRQPSPMHYSPNRAISLLLEPSRRQRKSSSSLRRLACTRDPCGSASLSVDVRAADFGSSGTIWMAYDVGRERAKCELRGTIVWPVDIASGGEGPPMGFARAPWQTAPLHLQSLSASRTADWFIAEPGYEHDSDRMKLSATCFRIYRTPPAPRIVSPPDNSRDKNAERSPHLPRDDLPMTPASLRDDQKRLPVSAVAGLRDNQTDLPVSAFASESLPCTEVGGHEHSATGDFFYSLFPFSPQPCTSGL